MRPRELTIEGFRSYRSAVTIDWRDRRLVGIVGPIGAGKSSILDAIAFALYGRTPGVAQNTRSLIHQLCDQAHVALTFEVDGQVWKAVRAPKRKGQSGHQLLRLKSDETGAPTLETVTQEGQVNAKVEQLLGMDFATFCRSVLLAQNRFNEFLHATPTERDKVLKGVFGYERLDAAKIAAERHLDRQDVELEALARERQSIEQARLELEDARRRSTVASERLRALDDAAPQVAALREMHGAAAADEAAASQRAIAMETLASGLPPGEQVDDVLIDAAGARRAFDDARTEFETSEQARAAADAELALVHERLGDRAQLRSFEKLVDRHATLAEASTRAAEAEASAVSERLEAERQLEVRRRDAEAAVVASNAADELVSEAAAAVTEAREALDAARHEAMAHELRGSLTVGEPCPVCAQPIVTMPRKGAAPKAVAAATKELRTREKVEGRARQDKEEHAATVGAARTAVAEAETRAVQAGERAQLSNADLRAADAELSAVKDLLTQRLGDGEPHALVSAVEAELTAAEGIAKVTADAVETARRHLDFARERSEDTGRALTTLANTLAGIWGGLGEPRTVEPDPDQVRAAFIQAGESIMSRLQEATAAEKDAADTGAHADQELVRLLERLGLEPEQEFDAVRADAGASHAAAVATIEVLEAQLTRADDLEREVLEAEARRALAKRLADDLKPSRFLAFLLEEERAELAELGSGLFDSLTGGTYRFAADDSFDVVDLNAADRTRRAESLSGGETFLASLALALALAEMVARGGGRLDAFFLDEGFGSLDPEHLDRAMDGIGRLVADDDQRLVVLVSHVAEMRTAIEDLVVLDKDDRTGDTVVVSGATPVGVVRTS
jgi:exonuclease SbcC